MLFLKKLFSLLIFDKKKRRAYREKHILMEKYLRDYHTARKRFKIGRGTYTHYRTLKIASKETVIGSFCSIAEGVQIGLTQHPVHFLTTHPFSYRTMFTPMFERIFPALKKRELYDFPVAKPCRIGNDVWIGASAMIMDGVTVGDGAIIAANAVVTKDVPPYAIAGGVPAKVIKYRFSPEIIEKLLQLKWWDLEEEFIMSLPINDIEASIKQLEKYRQEKES